MHSILGAQNNVTQLLFVDLVCKRHCSVMQGPDQPDLLRLKLHTQGGAFRQMQEA